ncbi:phage regulatory CII family protein [Rahnella sp. PAMC25617]|uniref:phage regulatory CII family protein n=1 Tax=Rahnella sp. PAMC25617 TaxID=3399684 RepID=UPI003D35CD62
MFDYQTSIHPYLDTACRRFSLAHNLTEVAAVMGISAQVLRNKLNPEQPHRLTVNELIMLTDITDDSAVLDGLLAQLKCLPAVPVNEAKPDNLSLHTLSATAAIGVSDYRHRHQGHHAKREIRSGYWISISCPRKPAACGFFIARR